jgi:subtilisin family serine protease
MVLVLVLVLVSSVPVPHADAATRTVRGINGPSLATDVSGEITEDTTWTAAGSPYVFSGTVTVKEGATLTIEPGVKVQGGYLQIEGHLEAVGSEANPIVFTSQNDSSPGEWRGIAVWGGTMHLDHATVRYAGLYPGGGRPETNIHIARVQDGGEVLIENSLIAFSSASAMVVDTDALRRVQILNTSFHRNENNEVLVTGNVINFDATLFPITNGAYYMNAVTTVQEEVTLTVEPGTTVTGGYLVVEGHLEAVGTPTHPITFTSRADSEPGEWPGIAVHGGTMHLNHTTVRYAGLYPGGGRPKTSIYVTQVQQGGEVLIENSQLLSSKLNGLEVRSGDVSLRCVQVSENEGKGIYIRNDGYPVVSLSQSQISDNGEGLNNTHSTEVEARDTWWGSESGPSGDGPGTGDSVSGNVRYDPWLYAPPACISSPPTSPPSAFRKSSPANEATDQALNTTLEWSASKGATGYRYCIDTTNDNACDGGDEGYVRVDKLSATPNLLPGITYYWQVRAYNSQGEVAADGEDSWWSFTTVQEKTPAALEITPDSLESDTNETRILTIKNVGREPVTVNIAANNEQVSGWEPLVFPTQKVDASLRHSINSAPDAQRNFLVYVGEQADLSEAYAIEDWRERGQYVYEMLWTTAKQSQAPIISLLENNKQTGDVTAYRSYYIVNAVLVTGNAASLNALEVSEDVAHIAAANDFSLPDPSPSLQADLAEIAWGIEKIGASRVWEDFGITGNGVVVANIDSGVLATHPALVNQYRGTDTGSHDYNWFDPSGTYTNEPGDNNGHGTHTMGTMVGSDGGANQIGVAPGATWIAAKGCVDSGCYGDHLLASAEWILAPYPIGGTPGNGDPTKRPHVVNNSWGGYGGRLWYQAAVQAWRAADIFPAFSAGNSGSHRGTVESPGDYAESFASGATDSNDTIAFFSSRGPSSLTDEIKPDVSAPGVSVRSAMNDGGYASMDGTSMASPHTAGCVALIRAANPDLDVEGIEDMLTSTANDLGDPDADSDYGYGLIDCYKAVEQARGGTNWLTVDPTGATIAPGESVDVSVTFNTSGLEKGIYEGQIVVTSDIEDSDPIQVPATLRVGGIMDTGVDFEAPDAFEGSVSSDSDSTISAGDTWLMFPEQSVSEPVNIAYASLGNPTYPLGANQEAERFFTLSASTGNNQSVEQTQQPYEITVRYDDVDLTQAGITEEAGLTFVRWDAASSEWVDVPTQVETTNNHVIGVTDRFGEFALVGTAPTAQGDERVYLPLVVR